MFLDPNALFYFDEASQEQVQPRILKISGKWVTFSFTDTTVYTLSCKVYRPIRYHHRGLPHKYRRACFRETLHSFRIQ